jgi:hypothetical protein
VSLLAMRMQGSQQMTSRRPDRPGSILGTSLSVALAAGACAIGLLVGRSIAYSKSVGGMGGAFEAAILIFFLIVAVIILVLVALIGMKLRHGHMSQPIATLLAVAGLLAIGALGGHTTAAAFGGLYRQPVVLQATGRTTIDLQAGDVPFAARLAGEATCDSVPDGQAVASITALALGELGSGTLRAHLSLAAEGSDSVAGTAEFWIDGGDLPEGSPQPSWNGPVRVIEIGPEGATGKLTFTNFEGFSNDPALKGPESPAASSGTGEWPPTISGVMGWTCEAW